MPDQQVIEDVDKKNWHRPAIHPRRVIDDPPQPPQLGNTRIKREPHDPEDPQVLSVGGTRNATPNKASGNVRAPNQAVAAEITTTTSVVAPQIDDYGEQAQKPASEISQNAPTEATSTMATIATVPPGFATNSNFPPNVSQLASKLDPQQFFEAMRALNLIPQGEPTHPMCPLTTAPHPIYPPFPIVPLSNSCRPDPPPANTTPTMKFSLVSTPRAPQTTQPPNLNMPNMGPGISQSSTPRAPPQQMRSFDPSIMPHQFQAALINSMNFPSVYLQQQLQQLQHPFFHVQNIAAHENQTSIQPAPTNQIVAQPLGSHQMPDLAASGQNKPNANNGKQEQEMIFKKHITEGLESATKIFNQQQSEIAEKDDEIVKLKMELELEKSQFKTFFESTMAYHAGHEALERKAKLQEDELKVANRNNVEKDEKIKELSGEVGVLQEKVHTQKNEYENNISLLILFIIFFKKFEKDFMEENARKLAGKNTEIEIWKEVLDASKEEIKTERSKTQDLTEKLNVETSARKSNWSSWNAARAEERKQTKETHRKETVKLILDHKGQLGDLQRLIEDKNARIKEANKKNVQQRKEWKEAREKEIKETEETHRMEKEKLDSDHKVQVGDLQQKIQERDAKIEEANERNERDRAEQGRQNQALKDYFEKLIQEKDREIEAGKQREQQLQNQRRTAISNNIQKLQQWIVEEQEVIDELGKTKVEEKGNQGTSESQKRQLQSSDEQRETKMMKLE